MSRLSSGEQIQVRPTNNVYTVLAIAAFLAQCIGLLVIVMRSSEVGGIF
jgi:hypothetical protein